MKVSQNPETGGIRATLYTLTLSQWARGLFSAPGRLPLPLGEGWGEGSSSSSIPNRGASQLLRQFHIVFTPALFPRYERAYFKVTCGARPWQGHRHRHFTTIHPR